MQHFLCGLVLRCKTVRFAVANGLAHLRERFGMLRMRGLAPLERFGTAFAVRFGAEARGGGFMHTGGYEGLVVYNKAIELSEEIGALVTKLPKHEKYELASQLRRAADSISSNISEGNGRSTIKDYISFLYNAKGSTQEVQTQLHLCVVHGYLTKAEIRKARNLSISVRMKLIGLINSLQRKDEDEKRAKKSKKGSNAAK